MSAKVKNSAIGTCPCPVKNCEATCEVKKFQHRSTRDTGVRYAGKLYLICPEHGRLGMDGLKAMQEFILAHAKIPNRDDLAAPPAPPPAPSSTPAPPVREERAASPPAPARKTDWW